MIKITGWPSMQSYKDRRPPWIRFHRTWLDDYEYQTASDFTKYLLPMLWLLACEDEDPSSGAVPYNVDEIAFRLRSDRKKISKSIEELAAKGLVELHTGSLRDRYETVTTETETETEAETDGDTGFDEWWKKYDYAKGKKKALSLWSKMSTEERGACLDVVEKYVASTPEKRYRKHPPTYLNQRAWEDEITDPVGSAEPSFTELTGFGETSISKEELKKILGGA